MEEKFNNQTELNNKAVNTPTKDNASYKVNKASSPEDKIKENIAYIQAQGLSRDLELKAIQIAESGIGSVTVDYNANEPQLMVDTVFNKTYNADNLLMEDGKVIPADWGISANDFNGDYMNTYTHDILFREIAESPAVKITDSVTSETVTMTEELKNSMGVITQAVGSNDSVNGMEVHYEDLSGETSLLQKEAFNFNIAQDNLDVYIPYSRNAHDETVNVTEGNIFTSSHTAHDNPEYKTNDVVEEDALKAISKEQEALRQALTEDVLTQTPVDKIITAADLNGSSSDLDPTKNNTNLSNPFNQTEVLKNDQVIAEIVPVPNPEPTHTDNRLDIPERKDEMRNEKTEDTIGGGVTPNPEETPFNTNDNPPPNLPEIKESLNEKQVLRQFKGYDDNQYMRFFVSISSASVRMVKNSMVQGDESTEIETASKIARTASDVFSYCDMVSGTSAANALIAKQIRYELITSDVKNMIDQKIISFDDLTGDKGVGEKLRAKGLRAHRITAILQARDKILTNLKAQEVLYQFATESGKFTPEQLALLKNNTFFNDIEFGKQLTGIYATYFANSDNEMLKKVNPATMSRKDFLKFDRNVQRAEHLYQRSLSGNALTADQQAFVDAYRLNEKDKLVYDKAKNEKLAHTDKKGRDKINKVKGIGRKRFSFWSKKAFRAAQKATSRTAEGKMVSTVKNAVGTAKTAWNVAAIAAPVAWKTGVVVPFKIVRFTTKPVRHLANEYILKPAVQAVKDFAAVEKAKIQNSEWYMEKQRQQAEKRKKYEESEKGKKAAQNKKQREAKQAKRKEDKEAKNKDKRAKKEKKATKKNARKSKLGKIGKVVGTPVKLLTFPFRGIEELISLVANKLKSLLVIPALKVLVILVPIVFILSIFSRGGGGDTPLHGLYNNYIIAGNDEDGVNFVYKWNAMMEEWQADIDNDIRDMSTTKPHTCNDYRIFGEDFTCSVCGAFILGQEAATSTDAEGLKNEEVYYDTKIYAYGSPKSYDDPTADWYHNANATIDPDKLNGYRIYYLNAKGEVIASSTTNIKDLLCLMAVWRENYFMSNDYENMDENGNPERVNKKVEKTLEWLWERFKPIVSTQVSDVYHTEYSTDKFPKNGSTYKCTDNNFYTKYNDAVSKGVMMYDTVAPQQTSTPSVEGYICSGKGCKYDERWEWGSLICPKSSHTHGWGCNSYDCSHVCNKGENGACKDRCVHSHTSACCSKTAHTHSTARGCYKKNWYREYYCDGNHEALHCSYGYRDLNIYVTTFKIADIIQLRAADEIASQDYITFTNTLLNKKLGTFESNKFYNFAGFPYTFFLDNSDGSRFTNRLEWAGDAFLYFYVPQNFTRNDSEFRSSLKAYQKTVNLKDAYDKGYISKKFFFESIANLTEAAIEEGYDGFNCFDYERHKEMTDMYGLESTMGFKICPDADLNSESRQKGGGISETGCTGTVEWLFRMYTSDWMEAYGIDSYGITSIEGNNTLDSEEIEDFLVQIDTLYDDNVSFQRKQMVRRVLNTVGKIPYWAGGQPTSQIYNSRWGRTAVETDPNYEENLAAGRTSFGLDAMGYFRYIYWSTVYRQPNFTPKSFYETSGIQEVSYTDLKPGDIGFINPPTAEFNVIGIFVGYQDGVAKWVYMDKAAGTVVLTNGGSVSGSGTQGSFAYFYKFLN